MEKGKNGAADKPKAYKAETPDYEEISDMTVCSSAECTGLIPAAADASERKSYEEIYPFLPPKIKP